MPVYLFTYHAYGSWMPDHERGYTPRGDGVRPPNDAMAERYRANQRDPTVVFDEPIQRLLIDETQVAAKFQRLRVHFLATEPTHLHALVSWTDGRPWHTVRAQLRASLTRRMNRELRRRTWFGESASRRAVVDQEHFDHLVSSYLPDHGGWKWSPAEGLYR